ncbi:MAG: type II toxin-antitoxin system HipA family toxin [Steroidobacteraceae bacterium]
MAPRVLRGLDELAQAARVVQGAEEGGEIAAEFSQLLVCGTSIGGARPKFTLLYENELWLAKLPSRKDSTRVPSMPLRECAALDLAAKCGIEVPEHRYIDAGGTPALLVRRFDRKARERFAYVSARTVAWSNPEAMRFSYMASYVGLSQELARWIPNPADDRRALYERIVFNAATANGDDHDANHGLVRDRPEYGYRLAPLFDPVASSDLPAKDLAMAFGEEGRRIGRRNLLSRARRFGLDPEQASERLARMGAIVSEQWRESLRALGAEPPRIDRLAPWFAFAEALARGRNDGTGPEG